MDLCTLYKVYAKGLRTEDQKQITLERQTVCRDPQLTSRTSLSASFFALRTEISNDAVRTLMGRNSKGISEPPLIQLL